MRHPIDRIMASRPKLVERKEYDNFYVRALLGERGFDIPFGSITSAHQKEAAAKLRKFTFVITNNNCTEENRVVLDDFYRDMIPVARGYLEYIAPHDKKCTCLVPDEAPNACAKRINQNLFRWRIVT